MKLIISLLLLAIMHISAFSQDYKKDIISTQGGDLEVTIIAHGSLLLNYSGKAIYVDPVSMFGTDFSKMPMADLILITHSHGDHLDAETISQLKKDNTPVIVTPEVVTTLGYGEIMKNGDTKTALGIEIKAVPAYNIDKEFHPKGVGNGYIFLFGDKQVYVAGDTDYIPEMDDLHGIDVAFLPMNNPYTMTPKMVADAAKSFRPAILYPYHLDNAGLDELLNLMSGEKDIEVRVW